MAAQARLGQLQHQSTEEQAWRDFYSMSTSHEELRVINQGWEKEKKFSQRMSPEMAIVHPMTSPETNNTWT